MRQLLVLIFLLMEATAAVIVAWTNNPSINTVLALGWGGLAFYAASLLLADRFP